VLFGAATVPNARGIGRVVTIHTATTERDVHGRVIEMANPYVVVVGNICAGKTTFVNQFSADNKDWYGLPEALDESQNNALSGPDMNYLYASFFTDYYINCHLLSRNISGPMIQESCLETSSLFQDVHYENNGFSKDKYDALKRKYSKFLKILPRPDFYIYLYAPLEVLLARADNRKDPSRTLSKKLLPRMQHKLDDWVEKHVNPNTVIKINTHDVNIVEMNIYWNSFRLDRAFR
jgi:deoxyadenosine/deoxycytidine kinase